MRTRTILLALGLLAALGSCTSTRREWMKIGQTYTVEEFRRDFAQCTRGRELDEACMRERGWVDMSQRVEKPKDPRGDEYDRSRKGY
jgi:hypothetical protein